MQIPIFKSICFEGHLYLLKNNSKKKNECNSQSTVLYKASLCLLSVHKKKNFSQMYHLTKDKIAIT